MDDPNSVTNHYGAYRGPLGEPLHRGPNGDLLRNGLPTGLSVDIGGRVVRTPYRPPEPVLGTAPPAVGAWPAGSVPAQPPASTHGPSFAALPIYLWMALLALCAGLFVSGSTFIAWDGLHRHPVYGVAAAFAVVALYRYGMTWFPTALILTLASASLWAVPFWAWRHQAQLRDLPTRHPSQAPAYFNGLLTRFERSMLTAPDPWVLALAAAAVALHLLYWRHRRAAAAEHGWLFNRGLTRAAGTLFTLAATACALGLAIGFLSR